ncbi:MAG: PadR family transcriptional regulator [Clostridiales Family XIII bacterium]|jgi:PadR family transcriptional regulator PadR|nr:PadR family transcriptional regulator [Clostridiales Family XIII bacterium]
MDNKGSFIRGSVDMIILALLQKEDCYGYQLTMLIKEYSGNLLNVPVGSLYPSLYKMEERGYISTVQKVIKNRTRMYYHLESAGKDYLVALYKDYCEIHDGIDKVLRKCSEYGGADR